MYSVADIWKTLLQLLQKELSETTIATWFDELEAVDLRDGTFYLYCPSEFKRHYVESLYTKTIKAALKEMFSMEMEVILLDQAGLETFRGEAPQRQERFAAAGFTFETFVVGESNKLAYAASRSVAEHPGQNYNPLLIYGDSGLGKTHLLYAIADLTRKLDPTSKIVYIKGDDFINEFIELVRTHRGNEFRSKYREAKLLLVDDVQFLAGKDQTQDEFFHTFNALHETGRQIVLTSDRPPSEMTLLDDRLRTRFQGGVLADVKPPDLETRMAIVKNKAAALGMTLPDKIVSYVAENAISNVRQLEGTVHKILAYKDLLGNEADEETVERAMQDIMKNSAAAVPKPDQILEYISRHYDVDKDVICGPQRVKDAVIARQIAIYLIRSMTNLSMVKIGKLFGNRDHATVDYSIKQVELKMKEDPAFAEKVKEIKYNIVDPH